MSKKTAVIDMTHGGVPIAQKLNEIGFSVTAIDVYNSLDLKKISTLNKKGIEVRKEPIDVDEFDFIVAPLHLNPDYTMLKNARKKQKKIISHHEIVNKILSNDERIKNIKFIEISGTKAKTGTAFILATIISENSNLILHTSHGLMHVKNGKFTQIDRLSITPGNILQVIDKTISLLPVFYIFEVSVGFTGYADLNILTTLNNDVLIAGGSKYESDAILQTIYTNQNSTFLVNSNILPRIEFRNPFNLITFNENQDLEIDMKSINYDLNSYRTALSASISASIELGIDYDTIISIIRKFKGVEGRMIKKDFKGRILIDNSNSGMDEQSVKSAFEYALTFLKNDKKFVFVLGLESKTVCEGLDIEELIKFIKKQHIYINNLILVNDSQESTNSLVQKINYETVTLNTASNLENGLSIAINNTKDGDIILSCVKCFR
ncbi:MAG: coenzyme F430 synthase [Methanobacteriaceae archaeon]|jgi:UDP-N-acetylmuramoylalanine-D-glutamate ligase